MRSVPQLVSVAAICLGVLLFAVTVFYYIDLEETIDSAARLGLALPIILLPGTGWHLLRTWGWSISFPDEARPGFVRLFRVRLASDAIDRSAPQITTAAIAVERLAFAVMGIIIAGFISFVAVRRLSMPVAWDTVFTLLSVAAILVFPIVAFIARRRTGDYLGRIVERLDRALGRQLESSRVVRFILDVEDVVLELLRGDRRRLVTLCWLPIVCYLLMALEVWLVFWAIGEPIGVVEGLAVETFARLGSVASAAIPANIGALEASNASVVAMLGLTGGGSLALTRRIRALLWAGLGLALYPRMSSASVARRSDGHATIQPTRQPPQP
jgi:hypothetical protein